MPTYTPPSPATYTPPRLHPAQPRPTAHLAPQAELAAMRSWKEVASSAGPAAAAGRSRWVPAGCCRYASGPRHHSCPTRRGPARPSVFAGQRTSASRLATTAACAAYTGLWKCTTSFDSFAPQPAASDTEKRSAAVAPNSRAATSVASLTAHRR